MKYKNFIQDVDKLAKAIANIFKIKNITFEVENKVGGLANIPYFYEFIVDKKDVKSASNLINKILPNKNEGVISDYFSKNKKGLISTNLSYSGTLAVKVHCGLNFTINDEKSIERIISTYKLNVLNDYKKLSNYLLRLSEDDIDILTKKSKKITANEGEFFFIDNCIFIVHNSWYLVFHKPY